MRLRLTALCTSLCLAGNCLAATATLPMPPAVPELPRMETEGKVVWGILLKVLAPSVFEFFSDWLKHKIAAKYDEGSLQSLIGNAAAGAVVNLGAYMTGKDIVLVTAEPNVTSGSPETPLKVDSHGENYQGVNIALVSVDPAGRPTGFHALSDGFHTGERFKLRVTSTFDAVVVLGNRNPKGVSSQIYPARSGYAVSIPAGKEILLPLGEKEYLQFAGETGQDQLTFTVRDSRSLQPGQAASTRVYRKDDTYGSNFVQEVQADRYPVIAEAIRLEHRAAGSP